MDNKNRGSKSNGKSWVAVAVIDDLSDLEKNAQMYNLKEQNLLVGKDDRVKEFDTEKMERFEKAWSK